MPKILDSPKETILKEAKILLREKSYKKFSMRELANRSNIATGTLYNYYKNKFDIIRGIFIDEWRRVIHNLSQINYEDTSFDYKIITIYNELDRYLSEHMEIFMELSNIGENKDSKEMNEHMEMLYQITDKVILFHEEKKDIKLNIPLRTETLFIVNNILTIIKTKYMTIDDFIKIIKK